MVGGLSRARPNLIEVRDPDDESVVGTVPSMRPAQVEAALARGHAAAPVARNLPRHVRIEALRGAADRVSVRRREFAETIAREGIKTIREATREVARTIETLRLSAEAARNDAGRVLSFDQRSGGEDRVGYWFSEPVGLVVAITPFNDPLNLVAHKIGPAIASGNAIIVKPHSATPLSAIALIEAVVDSGLPSDIAQVVTGHGAEIGDLLISDPRVALVSFTGGQRVGDHVASVARRKRLIMELGANNPTIVLRDADLDAAAEAIISGAFWAAGQNCLHAQRVIVETPVADELTSALVGRARGLRQGPKLDEETDIGPLIDVAAVRRVADFVDDAESRGGVVLIGGAHAGTRFAPTLIDRLPADSRLARDEVFGPVTGITRVESLDEAIEVANDVDLGLQAAVFTSGLEAAMRVVREVHAGGVMVNDSPDFRLDPMPFGGVKSSGLGREGIEHAINDLTTTKVVCLNL